MSDLGNKKRERPEGGQSGGSLGSLEATERVLARVGDVEKPAHAACLACETNVCRAACPKNMSNMTEGNVPIFVLVFFVNAAH